MVVLTKKSFELYEIEKKYQKNFKPTSCHDLSDFHAEAIKWIGDAMRQKDSQFFWQNGCYCWFTDATQSKEQGVYMTENGIAMFYDRDRLYRISFVH